MTKAQIRIQMKKERDLLSSDEKKTLSKEIQNKLYELDAYKNCTSLFTYVSFQSEVDTWAVISQAQEDKKQIYTPRVEGSEMDFYQIHNTNTLIRSNYGVLEPLPCEENRYHGCIDNITDKSTNKLIHKEMKLMLLPGLAFDASGNRIGYGAGYYDRYLAKHSKDYFIKIAVAYDFQIMNHINAEQYDVKADMILTPTKILVCSSCISTS